MTESAGPYPIRPIGPDELGSFDAVDEHAFGGTPHTEAQRRLFLARFELDRSLAAFDGAAPVGIAAAYSFRLSVPGRRLLAAAGVSMVAVLPTHRRRGVLSSLMRRQLADVRDRGEPIAVLWASEAPIYPRYGYGRASWHASFSLGRGEGALADAVPARDGLRLRLADPAAAVPELAKVYDAVLPERPGFFARTEAWWQRETHDPASERPDASPLRCVLAEDDGGPRGYALYSTEGRWDDSFLPGNALTVRELMAADTAAAAVLWADLLSRDLTAEFRIPLRPLDDPLLHLLADPRRARPRVADGLWARITDVPAALAARRYSCPVDVVIEVRDDLLPSNAGRWRLTVADAGPGPGRGSGAGPGSGPGWDADAGLAASCAATTDAADLALGIADLSAAYLGGTRLGALAAAGRVAELRPGAARRLSAAMSWDPAPWCPAIF
ncbi:MAG TPA: GNAT family N-acetyltransferase [Streptosporangiaceae bacterium]|jgi:predicted acetyltransferase|nr:GNAT family N-acetyltransferase [Streptosporangiaceae bacterium]